MPHFSSSSPESALNQSSRGEQPFAPTEVFSASSRTRDSIPEQYRAHFDELRGSILAFCKEFYIPVETLRSKEAFGAELTSKKISQERMAEAVSLFEHLEHLVTHGKPLEETHSEYVEEAERLYHLSEQYDAQVTLLEHIGVLKDGAITGIDGHDYPIPTVEQIAQRLYEQREKLEIKHEQGFTKLLLVPFGMSLAVLIDTFRQFLLVYKQTHPDFDLDTTEPLWIWGDGYQGGDLGDSPDLVYNPQSFDTDRLGQTKLQILEQQADDPEKFFPGWRVHLFQPSHPADSHSPGIASIPEEGRGRHRGAEIPRLDIEANKSYKEYFSFLQQAKDDPTSPYYGESGLTPEDWVLAFIMHLQETGQTLDSYQEDTGKGCFILAAVFPSSIPCMSWNHRTHRAFLFEKKQSDQSSGLGTRTSVLI